MKNALQKRVAVLYMLVALASTLTGIAPLTYAYGETDDTEVISDQYPSPTDAPDSAYPTPAAAEQDPSEAPAPSESVTPEPTNSADITPAQNTPEPTATPQPTVEPTADANASAVPEALSVRSMYAKSKHFAAIGQTVTLEFVLVANNASGQSLSRFGVRFQTSPDMACKVKAINQADTVRFVNQTLLVEGATVRAGHVSIAGEALKLRLSLTPFPEGGENTTAKVSIALLDGNGNAVGLEETDHENARIDLTVTYHLREQTDSPSETAEPDMPEMEAETPAPPAEGEAPTPSPTDTSPLDLSVEPDTDQEPENTDGTQPASTELPATEEPPAASATETPAENRQLAVLASIPYDQLKAGDTLTLRAQMIGYEGLNLPIRIQWQQHTHGQWVNVEGATGDMLTVMITPENLRSAWRYNVTIEQ